MIELYRRGIILDDALNKVSFIISLQKKLCDERLSETKLYSFMRNEVIAADLLIVSPFLSLSLSHECHTKRNKPIKF